MGVVGAENSGENKKGAECAWYAHSPAERR